MDHNLRILRTEGNINWYFQQTNLCVGSDWNKFKNELLRSLERCLRICPFISPAMLYLWSCIYIFNFNVRFLKNNLRFVFSMKKRIALLKFHTKYKVKWVTLAISHVKIYEQPAYYVLKYHQKPCLKILSLEITKISFFVGNTLGTESGGFYLLGICLFWFSSILIS